MVLPRHAAENFMVTHSGEVQPETRWKLGAMQSSAAARAGCAERSHIHHSPISEPGIWKAFQAMNSPGPFPHRALLHLLDVPDDRTAPAAAHTRGKACRVFGLLASTADLTLDAHAPLRVPPL